MQKIQFVKMSGTGNDFVMIDNRNGIIPEGAKSALAARLCARRIAVGADGLELLEASAEADVRMRIFNADGSEAEMCGNGARCLAHFAHALDAAPSDMKIQTVAGNLRAVVNGGSVKVELTPPEPVVNKGQLAFGATEREVHYTNTGVPHAVVIVDDLETIELDAWGAMVRYHDWFKPSGANVNFVQVLGGDKISIRTYERGVEGETLACGTGATACALVAASLNSWTGPVEVNVRSGDLLKIYFEGDPVAATKTLLEGAAEVTFRGELELEL